VERSKKIKREKERKKERTKDGWQKEKKEKRGKY
jgi:hypothetical protein